ncbi:hypothetical protein MXB_837 [Myxobolus squamalis]|nr:hypothetical protein MXB_837 [Myxobolus squamalis]
MGIKKEEIKKLKEEGVKQERKPFDRDVDLKILKPENCDPTRLSTDAVRSLGSRFSTSKHDD